MSKLPMNGANAPTSIAESDLAAALAVVDQARRQRAIHIKELLDALMQEQRFALRVTPEITINGQPAQVAIIPLD